MILVVSRDILIVGGIMLSWLMGNPLKIRPLLVSKLNTVGADRLCLRYAWLARLQLPGAGS